MKKSLIALAVAGAFAAPAFAATSNVDVYGIMHFAVEDNDAQDTEMGVVDRVSRIGFKGSEDLGGGMKAVWQIEQQINATGEDLEYSTNDFQYALKDSTSAFGGKNLRNTYVGLAGGFGEIRLGRHDTPYKMATGALDPFVDTVADYNNNVDVVDAIQDIRLAQVLAYISPNFNGLTVAAAMGMSEKFTGGNLTDNDDTVDALSIAAMYSAGNLSGSLAYQTIEVLDSTAWKLGVGYKMDALNVGFIYEDVEYGNWYERDSWMLNVGYTMGAVTLKAEYGQVDYDGSDDASKWVVGMDYALSKRTSVYALWVNDDAEWNNDDLNSWAIGVKHSF